jgi:hypothetical protein
VGPAGYAVKRRFRSGTADAVVSPKARKRNERTKDRMSTPTETSTGPNDDLPTAPIPVVGAGSDDSDTTAEPVKPRRSFLAGLSGVLTVVLLIMAVGMIVAQYVSGRHEQPGPGLFEIVTHVAAAVLGVVCYRATARRRGPARLFGTVVLLAITGALLWFFWWSAN